MTIEPHGAQDRVHPAWCDPAQCTADRGTHGSHQSTHRRVALTSGGIVAYLDHGHAPAKPLLVLEHRGCGCEVCEPLAVVIFNVEAATEAVAVLGELAQTLAGLPAGGLHEPWCPGHHIGRCAPAGAS